MKNKTLIFLLVAVVAATAIWFGWTTWHANRQLVTLHVRNMPLADVLRKIEAQTRTKIRSEKALDTRITLDVTDKPLAAVMDRLSEQAGAHWSTVYAVYGSMAALTKLEGALATDGKIESVGWTKLAPNPRVLNLKVPGGPGEPDAPAVDSDQPVPEGTLPAGAVITRTEDVVVRRGQGGPDESPDARPRPEGASPVVVRVVRKSGGNGGDVTEQEIWTPEELVAESSLSPRLEADHIDSATAEAAADAARKINGGWTTYLALRKSNLGMALGGIQLSGPRIRRFITRDQAASTNLAPEEASGPSMADLEQAAQNQRNREFGRLTPEQRIERARERARLKKTEQPDLN